MFGAEYLQRKIDVINTRTIYEGAEERPLTRSLYRHRLVHGGLDNGWVLVYVMWSARRVGHVVLLAVVVVVHRGLVRLL